MKKHTLFINILDKVYEKTYTLNMSNKGKFEYAALQGLKLWVPGHLKPESIQEVEPLKNVGGQYA